MPVTPLSNATVNSLTIRSSSTRMARVLLVALSLLVVAAPRAQNIKLTVINGSNGHPIASQCMNIWVGNSTDPSVGPLIETQTDTNGVIKLRFSDNDTGREAENQHLACGLLGIVNPVVKYGDTISIRSGYVLCQPHAPNDSWLAMANFSTKAVLQHGVVAPNTCGKATAAPQPGTAFLFVRPLTWWEKWKQ